MCFESNNGLPCPTLSRAAGESRAGQADSFIGPALPGLFLCSRSGNSRAPKRAGRARPPGERRGASARRAVLPLFFLLLTMLGAGKFL